MVRGENTCEIQGENQKKEKEIDAVVAGNPENVKLGPESGKKVSPPSDIL